MEFVLAFPVAIWALIGSASGMAFVVGWGGSH